MHLLYKDGLLTGFPSRVLVFSPLCYSTMHRVFRRFYRLFLRGNSLVPRSYSFRASSASRIFEVGLLSLEITPFGPAAPSRYSSYSFRASSASRIFEVGLWSLEITPFGPAAPSRYSSYFFQASSAFEIFEVGLWSLEAIPFGPAAPSRYSR
jgi:hypothetical protein